MQEKVITVYRDDGTTKSFMLVPEMASSNKCNGCYFNSENGEHECGDDLYQIAQVVAEEETGDSCADGNFIYHEVEAEVEKPAGVEPAVITTEIVKQVLSEYESNLCPSIHGSGEEMVAQWIVARINKQNDPEYKEFLRLKEKFSNA